MTNTLYKLSQHRSVWQGRLLIIIAASLTVGWLTGTAFSAQPQKTLIVGTKVTPPFAMKRKDGTWYGISIDLWREIMEELGTKFEWRELDLPDLIKEVADGSIDAAVGALTITAAREKGIDFSHPFYRTGLGIAVRAPGSNTFLLVTTVLALSFFAIGSVMWVLDWLRPRRFNRATRALRIGLLLVALVVIFSSLIAHIITFIHLNAKPIRGPADLARVTVATVPSSTSEQYLREHGISYKEFPSLAAGLRALSAGKIAAVLYDTALLQYLAKTEFRGAIKVLPQTFEIQEYGIAFPQGSRLRESVNQRLIAIVHSPAWQTHVDRYLAKILEEHGKPPPTTMISVFPAPQQPAGTTHGRFYRAAKRYLNVDSVHWSKTTGGDTWQIHPNWPAISSSHGLALPK